MPRITLAVVVALAALFGAIRAAPASAADACATPRWDASPRVIVHLGELGAGAVEAAQARIAVEDVIDELERVGGISTGVTSVSTTWDPFSYGDKDGVATPTIHVGFTQDLLGDTGNPKLTAQTRNYKAGCEILESQIVFPGWGDPYWDAHDGREWNFETPFDSGDRFYDTSTKDGSGNTWFRPVVLHELLHAFGLGHSQWEYAFMNHRGTAGFPWANRAADASVRPLPSDIAELRLRYPEDGDYYDVSVTNTWFKPDATDLTDEGAAGQVKLCLPSLGTAWTLPTYSGPCSLDRDGGIATAVACEGDRLRVRFAVNNGSTSDMSYAAYLYLSTDERLGSTDLRSPTWSVDAVDEAESELVSKAYEVPALTPGAQYRPIVKLLAWEDTVFDNDDVREDWIPLRTIIAGGCG